MLFVIVSLAPELFGGDLANTLKKELRDYYYFVVGALSFLAILIFILWSEGDKLFKKSKDKPSAEEVSEKTLQEIKQGLMESYQKRFDSKLAARYPINLELKYSTEGTTTKAPLYDNKTIRSTKIKEELISLFDKHRGRLLIVGEPGSGKTTLLLQLAHHLLFRQEFEIVEIPIIINMATWRSRFSSVQDWFNELLPQMGFSKGLTQQLLTENRLLPLFDGLDELAEEKRPACLNAIGEYGKKQNTNYVICSRIKEYAETVDAPVYCQIMIKPLTLAQIKRGLEGIDSPENKGILHAIKQDSLIAEAIKTPFYLNTVQLLFASMKTWEEINFCSDTLEGRKSEITEKFIQESTRSFAKYSSDKVKMWLAFLADRMNKNELVTFELVNLQYTWSKWSRIQLMIGRFVEGLVEGPFSGLLWSLIIGPTAGLFFGLGGGLFAGLLIGLFFTLLSALFLSLAFGLIYGFLNSQGVDLTIRPKDRVVWSWKRLITILQVSLTIGLTFALFVGLNFGLLIGLIFGLYVGLTDGLEIQPVIKTKDRLVWSWKGIKGELFVGMIIGLFFGLLIGLIFDLFIGLNFGLFFGLLIGLIFGLYVGLTNQLSSILKESYTYFIQIENPCQRFTSSMRALNFSILQYLHLKHLLYRKGLLPPHFVSFLQQATSKNILESDGGSWHFRHRILQDYFSEYWQSNYAKEETAADVVDS